jgi:tetratricopeptide (TPR) repeat protein
MTPPKMLLTICFIASFAQCLHAEHAYEVTTKAWKALHDKNWDDAVTHADKALRKWGGKAEKQNSGLTAYPDKDEAKGYANLNEVGTCLWIKGEALRQKGDTAGALKAYNTLIEKYTYAQCWDKKGWYWQPAKAARKKIAKLKKNG